ncbi:putative uncharacterized protein [Clostridium clostridioforme CAG:132]|uniref:Uncharacterized protein n=2 Tax=Enterocloster clostridioformis TaxID=1531 RepID=A0A174E9R5_9FIRM|nr:putative uncharacterized protein [[Clostridium] clostridioforme CAG:132]CUO34562.1 Uncharacterised protein [Enterocloster clostridioformis]
MRRYNFPFNGNRYVLNKSTGEIHDLDCETPQCRINEMNPANIINCMSYDDAWLRANLLKCPAPNGCHYCNSSRDNG